VTGGRDCPYHRAVTVAIRPAVPARIRPELGPVPETLLITLWARAIESRRPDAIIRDGKAVEIFDQIDHDFGRYRRGWKSQVGVAVRDRHIDGLVRDWLTRHREGVVINIGAGLDTRRFRLDDGRVRWIDLDLPEVIALRRRFIDETDRHTFIATSALDVGWIDAARARCDGRAVLLLAEGVLMFFARDEVRSLLERCAGAFAGCEMIFDLIGPLMVRLPWLHDTLPKTRARFRWGARSPAEAASGIDGLEVLSHRCMLDECPARWRWMRLCRRVPALRRQFFVIHLRHRRRARPMPRTQHAAHTI